MIRLLFVVGPPHSTRQLRPLLRAYRSQWQMAFCETASEALAMLEETSFDVVVASTRLVDRDTAEFLREVRDRTPQTTRIALGSRADFNGVLKTLGLAHQFLTLGFNPEDLYSKVSQMNRLAKRIHTSNLQELISKMDSLPSLPQIYFDLVQELRSDDASVDRVGELISRDVSMTAKVLQLVNSSFFGLRTTVQDANHAAALLGINALRPLVLTASIFRQLEQSRVPSRWLEEVFRHSLTVAGMARALCLDEGMTRESVDNGFLSGALHDLGKVVLADNFGKAYSSLLRKAEVEGMPLSYLEQEEFGSTHADVGGHLLSLWGLPNEIVEAVTFHHLPSESGAEEFSVLTAVHVANALLRSDSLAGDEADGSATLDLVHLRHLHLENRLTTWYEIAEAHQEFAIH